MNARIHQVVQRSQEIAHAVADFQARLILSVLYALFIVPVGLFVRLNDDPLETAHRETAHRETAHRETENVRKASTGSSGLWRVYASKPRTLRHARRQF